MRLGRPLTFAVLLAILAACSNIPTYHGPQVTRLEVFKSSRSLYLFHNNAVLKAYPVALGFAPVGAKQVEGDGKTPEGAYVIDRKNPKSHFDLSLGISYPNGADRARAAALGVSAGGDIFIHGQKSFFSTSGKDWTAGCIAVSDKQIRQIYAMVPTGTPIILYP